MRSIINSNNVLIKFRIEPWRTVLNSPRPKLNVCIFANFGVFTIIQSLSWMVWRSVVDQYKFLGVIFDRKLSFIPHINYFIAKCHKGLQLLSVVAHTDWGADEST